MKKHLSLIGAALLSAGSLALGGVRTDIELSEVRNPVKLRDILNANATAQVAGTNLPDTGVTTGIVASAYVTNATAATVMSGSAVTQTVIYISAVNTNASGLLTWTQSTNVNIAVPAVPTAATTLTLQKATPVAENTTP